MSARVIALVQARVSSSRLPGKVLQHMAGRSMIEHVMRRVQSCPGLAEVVLCTSIDASDDPLASLAGALNWPLYRGSLDDVLERFAVAAHLYQADHVLRVTGDCPLWDPAVGALVLSQHLAFAFSRLTTNSPVELTGWPDGLDAEVFSREDLERAHASATSPRDREHVTLAMRAEGVYYLLARESCPVSLEGAGKWSVDTEAELAFVREVYDALGDGLWSYPAVLQYLNQRKAAAA